MSISPWPARRVHSRGASAGEARAATPVFSANGTPRDVTAGPDGRIWFTQQGPPGRVARVNGDGTVTELTGGVTPGFSANATPTDITTGPDGRIWFTEQAPPGRVARVNGDGSVTEFGGGDDGLPPEHDAHRDHGRPR